MTTTRTASSTRLWLMPTLVVIGVVAAVIVAFLWGRSTATPEAEEQSAQTDQSAPSAVQQAPTEIDTVPEEMVAHVIRRDPDDVLAQGPTDAPVVLVVFSDYQCPFCARWSTETLPELQPYIDDGDLRVEWRDINMYGADSQRAALAGYAAGKQDQFWQYHEELFPKGNILEDFSEEHLTELAADLGLDTEQFAADLNSAEAAAAIDVNETLGHSVGAFSTPSFVMNDIPVVGAQPVQVFIDAFEQALAATQG